MKVQNNEARDNEAREKKGKQETIEEEFFQTANHLKLQGKLEQAISNYRQAIEACPKKADYYQQLGETLAQAGKPSQAETSYRKVTELKDDWFKPYYSLGLVLEKQGKIEQALASYQRSIKLNPNFGWSHFNLGNLYHQQGHLAEAANCYEKAIEVHPPEKSYWFHLHLGDILMEQGKFDSAIDSYTQANKIDPKNTQGQFKLGLVLIQKQNWQEAIDIFHEVIELKPDFHPAYVKLGDALCQIGESSQAIDYYQKALEIKPNDANSYQRLQECLVRNSELKDPELQNCYQIMEQDTNEPKVYMEVGKVFAKRGLVVEAVKAYLKVLAIQPTFSPVYENLKHATRSVKNLDELITIYRQIIQQHPHFLPPYVNLGNTLTQQGKIEEALECYKKAVYQKSLAKAPGFVKKNWDDSQPRQPHFIIIGAEKCGTSSLHEYIIQHPLVLEPVEKEIHFFTQHFNKGLPWYDAHFPAIPEGYNYITGEASTSYIGCHNNAPQRLFNLYPQVKLIAVLRNPVDRAISHYSQLVRLGRESRSLEEVVTAEIEVLEGVEDIWSVRQQYWSIGKGCLWHGLYVYFLERWMSVFPKEQFLILKSEDLFEKPGEITRQVFEFLGLPDYQLPSYPKYNSGGRYKSAEDMIRKRMANFFQPFNKKFDKFRLGCAENIQS